MEKRKLGNTGLEVTVLGYGAGALTATAIPAGRDYAAGGSCRLLNRLLDAGVNFIDTAPDYDNSEEIIGKAISHRRDEFYLATKCGCTGNYRDNSHIWTRDRLMKNIELSLRRMNTDHVDIWQLHNPIPDSVSQGALVEVMEQVRKQGKVRYVSISSTLPEIRTYIDWRVFATFQLPYSALYRQHERVITAAAKAGAGVIIRGGLADGEPKQGLAGDACWKAWLEADLDELRSEGESRTMFLLRFVISHPEMHTVIAGTKNLEHFEENLKAAEAGPLPAEVYAEAKRRLDAVGQTARGPRNNPGLPVPEKSADAGPTATPPKTEYKRSCKMDSQLNGTDRSYAIIGVNRKNSKNIAGLAGSAIKNGCGWLRLELCGKGAWNAKELENLRNGLDELGEFLIMGIMKNREFYLINLEEMMDTDEGCRIFSNMLLADSRGNYVLVPPQWRYDGRGLKLGHVDSGIKKYDGCTYDGNSLKCAECRRKNLENTGYDGNATIEFDRGIGKILENIKYLGKSKSVFKAYLDKLLKDKEKESGLLINENA